MQGGIEDRSAVSSANRSLTDAYLAKRPELLRFFTGRLGSQAAAEDLVQELYFKLDRVDVAEVRDPLAFLYRLGWNLMLDQMRQKRRALARDQAWSDTEVDTIGVTALDQAPAADVALEARQRLERLMTALSDLPAQTQRVFRLHKFEGLTHSETAVRLGISRSAVEKHVSTALRHLVAQKR